MRSKLLLFALFALALPANAARFPDKVEKTFVLKGDDAKKVLEYLGFPSSKDGTYRLPWAVSAAQCYKGQGENGPIYAPCDPTERINELKFSASDSKLVISGIWLDGETGSTRDVPRYAFMSPNFYTQAPTGDWKTVVDHLGEELGKAGEKSVRILDEETLLEIKIWSEEKWSQYEFAIDDRPLNERAKAQKRYEECVREHDHKKIDGGC